MEEAEAFLLEELFHVILAIVHEGCYYTNQEISLTSGTIEVAYAAYVNLRSDGVGVTIEIMNISDGSWTAAPTGRYAPNEYWDFHDAYPYELNVHPE